MQTKKEKEERGEDNSSKYAKVSGRARGSKGALRGRT